MTDSILVSGINQAQHFLKAGRAKEAYKMACQMLSQYPKDVSLLEFISQIELRFQLYNDAILHLKTAIQSVPNRHELSLTLAECFAANNQWRDAEKVLDKLLTLEDKDFSLLDSVAALFSLCHLYEKAKKVILMALEVRPNDAKLLYNLAIQQRFLGDLKGAENSLENVVRLTPDNAEAMYILSGLKKQSEQSNHIPFIQSQLKKTKKNNTQAIIQFNFALAKELEDLGEWQQSFDALNKGAMAKRQTIKYNGAQNIQILERTAILQSKSYLETKVPSCPREAPIFILGLPRTGSTLLDTIVSSHKDIVSAGELPDFPNQLGQEIIKTARENPEADNDKMALSLKINFKDLGQNYINAVQGKVSYAKHFTDKLPFNFQYCGIIKRALPNAKILHIRRDPMDSCYSLYKALFLSPYPYSYNLGELAQYFVAYYRLMEHWRNATSDSILDINYEDIIADQEKETRRVLEWCGLDWDPACMEFQKSEKAITTLSAPQVRQGLYSSSIGKWRHYEKEMEPVRLYLEKQSIPFNL